MTLRDQIRLVQVVIKQVDYDGESGRVTIIFNPIGIKKRAEHATKDLEEARCMSGEIQLGATFHKKRVGKHIAMVEGPPPTVPERPKGRLPRITRYMHSRSTTKTSSAKATSMTMQRSPHLATSLVPG